MRRRLIFLTHAEVEIDPAVPVPDWPLNARGRARHAAFNADPALRGVTAVYSSGERKARDGAGIHARGLGLPHKVVPELHENDRSATGYLPPEAFEETANAFFAQPDRSVSGWETAQAAQTRILAALRGIGETDRSGGALLVVSHGAVGALLRCHLKGREITRAEDQPAGGGCWFETDISLTRAPGAWTRI